MSGNTQRRIATAIALSACTFFFLAGLAYLPLLGYESDEALFSQALYPPRGELYSIRVGEGSIPLMQLTYMGALKAWIYRPITQYFGGGPLAVRIPMLLAGVGSLWLFLLLLRRVAGNRAAVIGCVLLAVDSTYLTTICFDWGPVALQHLLLLGGALSLVVFYQERREWALALGAFLLGLGLWDKALAIWMLGGIAVAGILTLRRQIFAVVTSRRALIATLAFLLGALPLLIYNFGHHWDTFRGNIHRETSNLPLKARFLMNTARGGMFGWLTAEDHQTPQPHTPEGALQKASAAVSDGTGHPRHQLLFEAFLLALLLVPLASPAELRLLAFSLITLAVAWLQMAVNANTGASVHHTILLWPIPELVVAVSLAAASRRLGRVGTIAVVVVLVIVVGAGVAVTNEYYTVMVRNGGAQSWTDGIFVLADYLKPLDPPRVYCMDWGILDSLRLLSVGRLRLSAGTDQVSKPELDARDIADLKFILSDPRNVFVAHTKDFAYFPDSNRKFVEYATAAGYRQEMLDVISDRYGRKVYELYRMIGK